MSTLVLLPAVDVVNGQAVRPTRGQAGTETVYNTSFEATRSFIKAGVKWPRLVDLNATLGHGLNMKLLQSTTTQLSTNMEPIGGIRDDKSLRRVLECGIRRVNLGTTATGNPGWTEKATGKFADRAALGPDVRGETLAGRGWTIQRPNPFETTTHFDAAGCARYVVTDMSHDGMLSGSNLELSARLCRAMDTVIIASGGASSPQDTEVIRSLIGAGAEGIIIGKALYSGRFALPEALDVAARASARWPLVLNLWA